MIKPVYVCLALALVVPGIANGQSASPRSVTPASPVDEFPNIRPSTDLGDVRGGDGKTVYQAVTDQMLSATNSGNVVNANSITSGAISFAQGAASGLGGIGNFVANTGNNNNLQGAISINVLITPAK